MSANWLPVPEHKVPKDHRPGTCTNDTKALPDSTLNFIKTHSLMDEPVPPFFGSPIMIRTGLISRFTTIGTLRLMFNLLLEFVQIDIIQPRTRIPIAVDYRLEYL